MQNRKVLVMSGCPTCDTMKQNGLCKEEICVNVSSKTGNKLAAESKSNSVPQCITINKNGKVVKCNTNPIIKKFTKKKK